MTATMPPAGMRVAGGSNVGRVRNTNEDAFIVEPSRGLFVVLDGMGGANAGDVASQLARDTILKFVADRHGNLAARALLGGALLAASAAVHAEAQAKRERHGMGTTVVACLLESAKRAVIAHVGDSRAYLLRDGRLKALTRDHTVVEELVDRGLLTPDQAERHTYKNVLSRNLGARPEARIDYLELELQPGDRVLLCSDGLYGYASAEGIQYVLGSGDAPDAVARELIELALRGGGGDNVTAIVIETAQVIPTTTQVVRTSGAIAWWQRRARFLAAASEAGLARNPIVRGLDPSEALDVVALSLCQAIFHDLEKSTGVNVWTFAQNLAGGWFERNGDWEPLRAMIDILALSARAVLDEIRAADANLGFLLDVAVSRALVVAELAFGGLLADQLRQIDEDLVLLQAAQDTHDGGEPSRDSARFIERPTIPLIRGDRAPTSSTEPVEVVNALDKTLTVARAAVPAGDELVIRVLTAIEAIATDLDGRSGIAAVAARDLYGVRSVDDAGMAPLFEALDRARVLTTAAAHQVKSSQTVRARVMRMTSTAHQRLCWTMTGIVLEAAAPYRDRLRDVRAVTTALREQVANAEERRASLERKLADRVDPTLPWGSRGDTEW
ncbi:MAG: PP2C family serine/threonine-protein phosphatase [Kofleriaceae bacterium]